MNRLIIFLIAIMLLGCSGPQYSLATDSTGRTHCKNEKNGQYVPNDKCDSK